jgi:hypothetical protein
VPDINALPDIALPDSLLRVAYPIDDKPVFFGHYWMSGEPELQSANALCLDYSAGTDGPLVTYERAAGDEGLDASRIVVHGLR